MHLVIKVQLAGLLPALFQLYLDQNSASKFIYNAFIACITVQEVWNSKRDASTVQKNGQEEFALLVTKFQHQSSWAPVFRF